MTVSGALLEQTAFPMSGTTQPWYTTPGWGVDPNTGLDLYSVAVNTGSAVGVAAAVRSNNETCANVCASGTFGQAAAAAVYNAYQADAASFPAAGMPATDAQLSATAATLARVMRQYGDRSTAPGVQFSTSNNDTVVSVLNCLYNPQLGACVAAGPEQLLVAYVASTTSVAGRTNDWYPLSAADMPLYDMPLGMGGDQNLPTDVAASYMAPGTGAGAAVYMDAVQLQVPVAAGMPAMVTAWNNADAPCANACRQENFARRVALTAAPAVSAALTPLGGVGATQNMVKVNAVLAALYDSYVERVGRVLHRVRVSHTCA